jgi:hypothetical protein
LANVVTDNRTGVATGEVADPGGSGLWENLGGTLAVLDGEISYDTYTGSIGDFCTTTRDGTFWNAEATGLFSSGDHAYLLINCGIVSLLATKANGGMTVRVTGATATDWAEFELFGSDVWPAAFSGGWSQIVVDIDELLANPTNTNGSPPTVGNIQRFGVTFITATVMPRMADNFWVGGFAILPTATPAIIIEGRDGGSSDWNFTSVAAVAAVQLSAVLLPGTGGSFNCRGPVQIGINDSSTHAFSDTNKTLLFDFQEVMLDGFYSLSALGNSGGTTDIDLGLKTGTGDDATGAQGGVIQADPAGARWDLDFNDPDLDSVNLYGVSMLHGDTFDLDDPAVSCISTLYIDCTRAIISNSEQLRISAIDANTADGVAFMVTDDMADIVFSNFEFSDGHAIELNAATPTTQTNKGNLFSGYTNSAESTDAAILNSAAGALTINNGDGSNLGTDSHRSTGGGSVSIVASVTVTFTVVDGLGVPIEFAKVFLETDPGGVDVIAFDLTDSNGEVTTSFSDSTPQAVTGFVRKGTNSPVFKAVPINTTIGTGGLDATITMVSDE